MPVFAESFDELGDEERVAIRYSVEPQFESVVGRVAGKFRGEQFPNCRTPQKRERNFSPRAISQYLVFNRENSVAFPVVGGDSVLNTVCSDDEYFFLGDAAGEIEQEIARRNVRPMHIV